MATASTAVYKFSSLAIYHESRRSLHETTRLVMKCTKSAEYDDVRIRLNLVDKSKNVKSMLYIWDCSFLSSNLYAAHSVCVALSYFVIVILFENFSSETCLIFRCSCALSPSSLQSSLSPTRQEFHRDKILD